MKLFSNRKNHFQLSLRSGSAEPVVYKDHIDNWQAWQRTRVEGFDGAVHIDLSDVWQQFLQSRKRRTCAEVTGYETIIKMGETHQLQTVFQVEIRRC